MIPASPAVAARWREWYASNREGFATVLGWDLWAGWDREEEPEDRAWNQLRVGLEVLWGGDDVMARAFFERALAVCERAAAEKTFVESASYGFPRTRGLLHRVRAHARAFVDGSARMPGIAADLSSAAADYETWCAALRGNEWDSQGQALHLAAMRLALLGGDGARARGLVRTRRRFKYHADERALLVDLASGSAEPQLRARLERCFDALREPTCNPDVFLEVHFVRLELALIHELAFGAGQPLDWWSAARAVSR